MSNPPPSALATATPEQRADAVQAVMRNKGMQQCATDQRLADSSISTCYEVIHLIPRMLVEFPALRLGQ